MRRARVPLRIPRTTTSSRSRHSRPTADQHEQTALLLASLTAAVTEMRSEFKTLLDVQRQEFMAKLEECSSRTQSEELSISAHNKAPVQELIPDSEQSTEQIPLPVVPPPSNSSLITPTPESSINASQPRMIDPPHQPTATNAFLQAFLRGSSITHFHGSDSKTNARTWVALFEGASRGLSDQVRIQSLMTYLANDALDWYAEEILPRTDTSEMSWTSVRVLFLARYGTATVPHAVAAEQCRMSTKDSVKTYAHDKMRLLRLAHTCDESAISLLTAGALPVYQGTIYAANPKTFDEWLRLALSIENSQRQFQSRAHVATVNTTQDRSPTRPKRVAQGSATKPSVPCRFCKKRTGKNEYHWHRNCPIPPPLSQHGHGPSGSAPPS